MIPLRLELDGFLSYRDPQVFDFTGAKLWVLQGPNGAGKSAIFDAVTYALFGEHRGGESHDERLIHQARDSAKVVFDFSVEGETYRIVRTIERRHNRKSRQALHLVAGNWQAVPKTDLERGMSEWIDRVIGIPASAFTASVLLRQGDSDRFLLARPRERLEIFMGLLDMEPYRRLERRAGEHARRQRDHRDQCRIRLERLPEVGEQDVRKAEEKRQAVEQRRRDLQVEVEKLRQRAARAQEYQRVSAELQQKESDLTACRALMARGSEILAGHAELLELRSALPVLRVVAATHEEVAAARRNFSPEEWQEAQRLRAELDRIYRTLPWLNQLSSNRLRWQEANEEIQEITGGRLPGLTKTAQDLSLRLEHVGAEQEDSGRERDGERDVLAGVRAERARLQRQLQDRTDLIGQATCDRCGQPLTADHLENERHRLEEERSEKDVAIASHEQALAALELRLKGLDEDRQRTQGRLTETRESLAQAQAELDAARQSLIDAQNAVDMALRTLPAEERRVATEDVLYPSESLLMSLAVRKESLKSGESRWDELDRLKQEVDRDEYRAGAAAQSLQSMPERWRTIGGSLDGMGLAELERRYIVLQPYDDEKVELDRADGQRQVLEIDIAALGRQLDEIPPAARVPVEDATAEVREAEQQIEQLVEEEKDLAGDIENLKRDLRERRDLEGQLSEAEREYRYYRVLEGALGKSGLQSLLVQRAQQAITAYANEALSPLSHGTLSLQLEPRGGKGEESLEILATDYSSGEQPMDVRFISGSQRFRAAVSLALAIGRYAGAGSRSIRSVLIDEGFGSLDRDGQQTVAEELLNLSEHLDRVMLVTHQEGMFSHFPHVYRIDKLDGASQAQARI